MKNHEVVPTPMICSIAGLRHGGAHKLVGELARNNLIARVQNVKCTYFLWSCGLVVVVVWWW